MTKRDILNRLETFSETAFPSGLARFTEFDRIMADLRSEVTCEEQVTAKAALIAAFTWVQPRGFDMVDARLTLSEDGPSFASNCTLLRLECTNNSGRLVKVVRIPNSAFENVDGLYGTLTRVLNDRMTFAPVVDGREPKIVTWPQG